MAEKKIFMVSNLRYFKEDIVNYEYFGGFAVSQKQKCIVSLHESINQRYRNKHILEISTKSLQPLGVELSAFNLKFFHEELGEEKCLENVFQSSKVFTGGGPYRDLLDVKPKDAKRDERLQKSGRLIGFNLYDQMWPLNPQTMFYDWIYIKALMQHEELAKEILEYDVFTDIEFNHKRSLNCQARAAAIFVGLSKKGELEEKISTPEKFATVYGNGLSY